MMYHHDFNEKIGFWYVIALAGQSNGMAYGEGIPCQIHSTNPSPV